MSYAARLLKFIKNKENGALLDAQSDDWLKKPAEAFELTSGRYQRYFITLWPLFENPEEFSACVQAVADKALKIQAKTPFSAIVSSTTTTKHLLDRVHSIIEAPGERLDVSFLGSYPLFKSDDSLLDFTDQRVLIITDVIASGTMAGHLAETVEQVGGEVVGVLAVLSVGSKTNGSVIGFGREERDTTVHSLARYELAEYQPRLQNGDATTGGGRLGDEPPLYVRIDPETVLPETEPVLEDPPLFSHEEMYRHFSTANAIAFGFYEVDRKRFSTAVNFKRLLNKHGDTIWKRVERERQGALNSTGEDLIPANAILISTFRREDADFKEYVEKNIGRRKSVLMPQRESAETSGRYFMIPTKAEIVQGKPVIIALASVNTSEKLRDISSLLAAHDVKAITVICLLNRMGSLTTNFITRIEKLLKDVRFAFIPIYSFYDHSSHDLYRMQQKVSTLFAHHRKANRTPAFKRLAGHDFKYFKPKTITSREFREMKMEPLNLPADFDLDLLNPHLDDFSSIDDALSLLCSHAVMTRSRNLTNYNPLIKFISAVVHLDSEEGKKEALYKIYGVLIANISHLRASRSFELLRATLDKAIDDLREQRFAYEYPTQRDVIKRIVNVETFLLFGLALFSFLDRGFDYIKLIEKVIFCDKKDDEWLEHPWNLFLYYGDERVPWCASMLWHFSQHGNKSKESAESTRTELRQRVRRLLSAIEKEYLKNNKQIEEENDIYKEAEGGIYRIKANLHYILADLSDHEPLKRHHPIRFLHSRIIYPRKGHNPINSAFLTIIETLQAMIRDGMKKDRDTWSKTRRVLIVEEDIKRELEDALHQASTLEEIAYQALQMFSLIQTTHQESERYLSRKDAEDSFTKDVKDLAETLQRVRTYNLVSQRDVDKIRDLYGVVGFDLWNKQSDLRKALVRHIIDFNQAIVLAMQLAAASSPVEEMEKVWTHEVAKYQGHPTDDKLVLMDPFELREILKNIFTNVRYPLLKTGQYEPSSVETELVPTTARLDDSDPDSELLNYYQFTVVSHGLEYGEDELSNKATFRQQINQVESFGGRLSMNPLKGQNATRVTLMLQTRKARHKNS